MNGTDWTEAASGSGRDGLNTVVFADWIFFGLTVAGLFLLRRSAGTPAGAWIGRPMRVPGKVPSPQGTVIYPGVQGGTNSLQILRVVRG